MQTSQQRLTYIVIALIIPMVTWWQYSSQYQNSISRIKKKPWPLHNKGLRLYFCVLPIIGVINKLLSLNFIHSAECYFMRSFHFVAVAKIVFFAKLSIKIVSKHFFSVTFTANSPYSLSNRLYAVFRDYEYKYIKKQFKSP